MSQLDEVVRSALSAARTRDGRLVGVTVCAPVGTPSADVARWVGDRLAARGLEGVEVHAMHGLGPVRVVSLEFTR